MSSSSSLTSGRAVGNPHWEVVWIRILFNDTLYAELGWVNTGSCQSSFPVIPVKTHLRKTRITMGISLDRYPYTHEKNPRTMSPLYPERHTLNVLRYDKHLSYFLQKNIKWCCLNKDLRRWRRGLNPLSLLSDGPFPDWFCDSYISRSTLLITPVSRRNCSAKYHRSISPLISTGSDPVSSRSYSTPVPWGDR